VFAVFFCSIPFTAGAVTINENEANSINRTYNDYNNYGYISSADDEDWWVISFSQEGMATFYLGSLPADYDMDLFKGSETTPIAMSCSATREYIRCHVYPGIDYRIKISSYEGYSTTDSYLFRAKVYNLQDAKIFTTTQGGIDTRPDSADCLPIIWNMGFEGDGYLNNSANAAFVTMPLSDIFVTSNHGAAGLLTFNNSYIYASYSSPSSADRVISSGYYSGELSNVDLVIYSNCESASSANATYGNLVTQTLNKGAFLCIGWKGTIHVSATNYWLESFFSKMATGANAMVAMQYADQCIESHPTFSSHKPHLIDRFPYTGDYVTSYAYGLVLK